MTNLSKSFCLGVFFPSGFGTDTHEKCCILISEIFPKTHLRLSSVDFFSRGSMPPNPPRTGAYTQFRPRYAPGGIMVGLYKKQYRDQGRIQDYFPGGVQPWMFFQGGSKVTFQTMST